MARAWLDRQGADQLQPWLDELQGLCREAGALQCGLAAGGVPGDQRPGKVGPVMQGRARVPVQFRDLEDAEGVHQRKELMKSEEITTMKPWLAHSFISS